MQRLIGLLVGAVFGMLFVAINAHEPLPAAVGAPLRVIAGIALAFVVFVYFAAGKLIKTGAAPEEAPRGPMFGKGYLIVVAVEVVALFGGIQVLRLLEQPTEMTVAWIAFVVGAHFVALAPLWKAPSMLVPGLLPTVLGIAGLIMAATGAVAWVPFVSGVLSGIVLLGGSAYMAWQQLATLRTSAAVK
jgi:hypothetical protein